MVGSEIATVIGVEDLGDAEDAPTRIAFPPKNGSKRASQTSLNAPRPAKMRSSRPAPRPALTQKPMRPCAPNSRSIFQAKAKTKPLHPSKNTQIPRSQPRGILRYGAGHCPKTANTQTMHILCTLHTHRQNPSKHTKAGQNFLPGLSFSNKTAYSVTVTDFIISG